MTITIPGGANTPAGGICVPCITGILELETNLAAVCWDTGPDGENATDQPLGDVHVRLKSDKGVWIPAIRSGTGPVEDNGDGRKLGHIKFAGLAPGEYTIRATKVGFARPKVEPKVVISPSATTKASISMRRSGMPCNRKHPVSAGVNEGPSIWLPVFWFPWGEPWVLWLRDFAWAGALTLMILGLMGDNLALTCYTAMYVGILNGVIFGEVLGALSLVGALFSFVVLLLTLAGAFVVEPLGVLAVPPLLSALSCANWLGFTWGHLAGRYDKYKHVTIARFAIWPSVFGGLLAAAIMWTYTSSFWWSLLALALGDLSATVTSAMAHIFRNEGKTKAQHFKPGFLLPFAGERYCVQGMRGMISHHEKQEFAYDFAIPEGSPVLACMEGHVVAYKEDRDGTDFLDNNSFANYVEVKHRDGSVAVYMHGKKDGVTSVNPGWVAHASAKGTGDYTRFATNVYVQAGQHLCEAGNVGVSMFSHIHLIMKKGPGDAANAGMARKYAAPLFDDKDVARHKGRCRNMRKYRSDNVNRGTVNIPADLQGY